MVDGRKFKARIVTGTDVLLVAPGSVARKLRLDKEKCVVATVPFGHKEGWLSAQHPTVSAFEKTVRGPCFVFDNHKYLMLGSLFLWGGVLEINKDGTWDVIFPLDEPEPQPEPQPEP